MLKTQPPLAKTRAVLRSSDFEVLRSSPQVLRSSPNRTLQELLRITLIKSLAFEVFEILSNLASMQNLLNVNDY